MSASHSLSFADALRFWWKLGWISFGGPAGQIAVMHRELVDSKRWISEARFLHALNYCMLLPGPEAQQLATYCGWLLHGTRGGLAAGILFVLPSLLLLIGLSWLYLSFGQLASIGALFYGAKAAVVAIIFFAAVKVGKRVLQQRVLMLLALLAFVAVLVFDLSFPLLLLAAAVCGVVIQRFRPQWFSNRSSASGHATGTQTTSNNQPALISDDLRPAHTRFSRSKLLRHLLIAAAAWLLPYLILLSLFGTQGTPAVMARFFTETALITFGGAYAVLPHVFDAAVNQFQWLSSAQMLDGLALGETTPGPLIMVVSYIGFVGGWQQQVLGPDALFAAGALSAVVVTWFTFLPSFVFILAGGPLVEATHGMQKLQAPLTAITAVIVAVIAHLGLQLALQVGFPGKQADWQALVLILLSGIALWRGVGVVTLVLGAAACGYGLHLAGLISG